MSCKPGPLAPARELLRQGYEFPRQQEILAFRGGKLNRPFDNALLLHAHGYAPDIKTAMQMIRAAGFHSIVASMAETVEAAHRSEAICILAHPGRHETGFTFYDIDLLDQLRAEIPIDGIEVSPHCCAGPASGGRPSVSQATRRNKRGGH